MLSNETAVILKDTLKYLQARKFALENVEAKLIEYAQKQKLSNTDVIALYSTCSEIMDSVTSEIIKD